MSVQITLGDLERRDTRNPVFRYVFYRYAHTISLTAITFGMVTHVGRETFFYYELHATSLVVWITKEHTWWRSASHLINGLHLEI